MIDIKSYTLPELEALLQEWGESKSRSKQLYVWLHKKQAVSFSEMIDLARNFREKLENTCEFPKLEVVSRLSDPEEGTIKYLFRLADGEKIETVYMPSDTGNRRTLCVSVQVGCRFNCRMCLTGSLGFTRNLTASEILAQIDFVQKEQIIPLSNIVFMGMGEPLDNFEALRRVLILLSDHAGRSFALRRITVSTIGIIDKVDELLKQGLIPNFIFSLNAPTEEVRSFLMPVNKKYSLSAIIQALSELPLPRRRRFVIAYVLIRGINDSLEDANQLAKLLPRARVKINLIPFNNHSGLQFSSLNDDKINMFHKILIDAGFSTFIRRSRGQKINAACGQLAACSSSL